MPVDGIADLSGTPTVVALSDVHGYRDRFESALLTLADHPAFDPLVERTGGTDSGDGIEWVAGDDAVLVFVGDLVNRGPDSAGCVALLDRLRQQAPDGHVRYLLGNHDLAVPGPSPPEWDRFWADRVGDHCRRRFWDAVLADDIALAFDGYRYTYSHAGSPDGVDTAGLNDRFRTLAGELRGRVGADDEHDAFPRLLRTHVPELDWPDVDAARELRETPEAGVVWLDFSFLEPDSPPQVVGHTTQDRVVRRGDVVCIDTVLRNADAPGGESVVVETADRLQALRRRPDGGVTTRELRAGDP